MQELARIVLGAAGYRVLLAGDAVTGLCLARMEHPDVAVVDDNLAQKYGTDLLDDLQHDPKTADIPVILISSQLVGMQAPPAIDIGIASNLQKPFQPPELLLMVDSMLQRKEVPIAV
jgi:two-component system alkaline phosphatase synthesis response regulator PhoP